MQIRATMTRGTMAMEEQAITQPSPIAHPGYVYVLLYVRSEYVYMMSPKMTCAEKGTVGYGRVRARVHIGVL